MIFVQIGSNGVIGLGDKFNSPNIQELDSSKLSGERILCPFWTVLHSVGKVGKVYYNTYSRYLTNHYAFLVCFFSYFEHYTVTILMLCGITFCICLKIVFVHCTTRLIIFQKGTQSKRCWCHVHGTGRQYYRDTFQRLWKL